VHALSDVVRVVRASSIHESAAVDSPPGSPPFLNMVVAGHTALAPETLLDAMLAIETRLGRRRRGVRNEPRVIDLDLIVYGGEKRRSARLTLPHPRARERGFVMSPLTEIATWVMT
jgi:2-amino-4-hydroxy-6-hydroxymethyldihydropteridine diphosphokinase